MKVTDTLLSYSIAVSTSLAALNNFTKYDLFWLVFTLGGIFIMVGHSIFDRKIKHSLGKIIWMVVTSFIICLLIKILYDEGSISLMSMIVSTLIASMVAPATISIALTQLPTKIAEQISALPEWFFNMMKNKIDKKDGNS